MASEKQPKRRITKPKKPYNDKHIMGFLFVVCLSISTLLASLLFFLHWLNIPDIKDVSHYQPYQTTYIYDKNQKVVERLFTENRTVVPLSKMPDLLGKAFVAAEDGRFFEHPGLDMFSVFRALINNIKKGRRGQGGSTITQQVTKSLLLTPEKTYLRKIKEAILAWKIDTLLTKDEILFIYLNEIYLGGGAHGVEAASQVYFGKHVWQLKLGEIAILAGLPQAPSKYSPLRHPERAEARQKYVLNRMAADGYITSAQAMVAYKRKLNYGSSKTVSGVKGVGYYTQLVKNRAQKYTNAPIAQAGLHIYTYLDSNSQSRGSQVVKSGVAQIKKRNKNTNPQGALVSIDACSGKVRALVGGTDFIKAPFNRAYQAKRQAGSVFKPMVYSAALENGWSSKSKIIDAPFSTVGQNGKRWAPRNFDNKFHGEVSLNQALTHSYNIPAVKLLRAVGPEKVEHLAHFAGISGPINTDLSLALGTVDVSLLEMSAAYSMFTCKGTYHQPIFIDKMVDWKGQAVKPFREGANKVISTDSARQMKAMLISVVKKGTGKNAQGVAGEIGGKTGTTNGNRDAWFIGFSNKTITGVWFGNDKNLALGKHENGGKTAAPVWKQFMLKKK